MFQFLKMKLKWFDHVKTTLYKARSFGNNNPLLRRFVTIFFLPWSQ